MSHTDLLIFFSAGTWVFFSFLFVYLFLVFYLLPVAFKSVGFNSFFFLNGAESFIFSSVNTYYLVCQLSFFFFSGFYSTVKLGHFYVFFYSYLRGFSLNFVNV